MNNGTTAHPKYRLTLARELEKTFLTDGGLETSLIFHQGVKLPEFASFVILKDDAGKAELLRYFKPFLTLARESRTGFILDTPTWRANRDWGAKLGYNEQALAAINRSGIEFLKILRSIFECDSTPILISGCIGPRGDGYLAETTMTASEAEAYHRAQIQVFSDTEADLVSAFTLNYIDEAIGIALAAKSRGMPASLSFTVETDGQLPSGQSVREAIERTDAATGAWPSFYMINCAHPTHMKNALAGEGEWKKRIRGIRANASARSHAELNESTTLDEGNPEELGKHYTELREALPHLSIFGGCCGTDHRHVAAICRAVLRNA